MMLPTVKVIDETPEAISEAGDWREAMHQTVLALDASAFERLTKRILREIDFVQVEVKIRRRRQR